MIKRVLQSVRRRQLNRNMPDRAELLHNTVRRFLRRRVGNRLPLLALTDAEYGWGNELWAAEESYLEAIIAAADSARGSIVECGSGLSTLLLATVTMQTGATLYSFEHNPKWTQRVSTEIRNLGLKSTVYDAPLHDYGEFDWYSLPPSLPDDISLVVCDGPPANTRGGRYGVLPLLSCHFAPRCTLLLDDTSRESEVGILARWGSEFSAVSELSVSGRGYASVTVDSSLLRHGEIPS